MVRWGMVGAGTIGREWMADAIAAQPDGELRGIASSNLERAQAFAREKGIPLAYDSVEALLADPEIDAVYISTTNEHHKPQTLAAAAAGKHVLCEKPLALTLAGAQEMVAACAAAGVVMGTNHHLRNSATHRAVRDLVASGAVGEVQAARVFHAVHLPPHLQGWRINRPESGGGVVFDITVHDADTVRFILSDEIAEVTAMTAAQGMGEGVEDAVMGVMRTRQGHLVQFHDSFTSRHSYTGLEVHGTLGSIYARNVMTQQPVGTVVLRRDGQEEEIVVSHENLYERSVRRFNAAVNGGGEPAATAHDGLCSLAVALAVLESAQTGCVAEVPAV
ncbi:MAG: Gfo/Idh/MocA family oxidoreductase [Thermomicrobiales bacterium]|nr:Gfo/Idh/MocA family oxidoreductase [Chloroflexia bacterium]